MSSITRGWPPERRRKQAENIRKIKPWQHSTGPKTQEGKATAACNSLKHGLRSAEILALTHLLRQQADRVKALSSLQKSSDDI